MNLLKELYEELKVYVVKVTNGLTYQNKKFIYARLFLANYKITPQCIITSLAKNDEGLLEGCRIMARTDDLSIEKMLGILARAETYFSEKFSRQVELDIDKMIEGLINEFGE